jgi:DMSO/TMAO reductase YedYZ molybdopterin-dependent catalytic subunit
MATNAGRTVHGVPRQALKHAANPILRIEGLVARPLALTPNDLVDMPRRPYVGEISCLERGNVPETDWSGVMIADLISLAEPLPKAQFVRVCAGPYAVPVALDDARQALLCDHLSGEVLGPERGGPWRLVVPGSRYYTSVKWVDRLELTAGTPDNSAERISQARARARAARNSRQALFRSRTALATAAPMHAPLVGSRPARRVLVPRDRSEN